MTHLDHTHKNRILALLCGVMFVTIVDLSVVNTALPSIQDRLSLSAGDLQWVTVAYGLAVGGFLLLGGWIGDAFGHRRAIAAGLTVIAIGSTLGALSGSLAPLVAARLIQGMGAALAAPNTLGLLSRTFAEGPERSRALGIIGAAGGVGAIAGSVLGGVLVEAAGWRSVFLFNLPVCALLVAAALAVLPRAEDADGHRGRPDVAGALTLTSGLMALVLGLHEGGASGWGATSAVVPLVASVALLAAFAAVERRSAAPLVPFVALRRPTLLSANVIAGLMWASFLGLIYQATLFTQQALGFSPLEAGAAGLPIAIVSILVSAKLAAPAVNRLGAGTVLGGGLACMAAGFLVLTGTPSDAGYWTDIAPAYALVGIGVGLVQVALQIAAFAGVDRAWAGVAGGLVETSRELGGAVGLAVIVTVAVGHAGSGGRVAAVTDAFHTGVLVSAGFATLGALVALLVLRPAERRVAERDAAPVSYVAAD